MRTLGWIVGLLLMLMIISTTQANSEPTTTTEEFKETPLAEIKLNPDNTCPAKYLSKTATGLKFQENEEENGCAQTKLTVQETIRFTEISFKATREITTTTLGQLAEENYPQTITIITPTEQRTIHYFDAKEDYLNEEEVFTIQLPPNTKEIIWEFQDASSRNQIIPGTNTPSHAFTATITEIFIKQQVSNPTQPHVTETKTQEGRTITTTMELILIPTHTGGLTTFTIELPPGFDLRNNKENVTLLENNRIQIELTKPAVLQITHVSLAPHAPLLSIPLYGLTFIMLGIVGSAVQKIQKNYLKETPETVKKVTILSTALLLFMLLLYFSEFLYQQAYTPPTRSYYITLTALILATGGLYLGLQLLKNQLKRNQQLNKQIEQQDLSLREICHELNGPLTPLKTHLYILRKGETKEAEYTHTEMQKSITKMETLVKDLLQVSKNQTHLQLNLEPCKINEIMEQSITTYQPNFKAKGITVKAELTPVKALVDPLRMGQIFDNLCSNLAKYTTPKTTVVITLKKAKTIQLVIKNETKKFTPDELKKFGLPYQRFHENTEGNGLGVPLCKKLVEKQGGTWQISQTGKTLIMTLTFRKP